HREMPRCDFYVQRKDPTGLHSWCKSCFKDARNKRRDSDPDKAREVERRSYYKNIDANRERDRKRSKTPESLARARSYQPHRTPQVQDFQKQYRAENREALVKYSLERRVRKAGLPSDGYTRREIHLRDNWTCQLCLEPIWFVVRGLHPKAPSIDHIVPITDPN